MNIKYLSIGILLCMFLGKSYHTQAAAADIAKNPGLTPAIKVQHAVDNVMSKRTEAKKAQAIINTLKEFRVGSPDRHEFLTKMLDKLAGQEPIGEAVRVAANENDLELLQGMAASASMEESGSLKISTEGDDEFTLMVQEALNKKRPSQPAQPNDQTSSPQTSSPDTKRKKQEEYAAEEKAERYIISKNGYVTGEQCVIKNGYIPGEPLSSTEMSFIPGENNYPVRLKFIKIKENIKQVTSIIDLTDPSILLHLDFIMPGTFKKEGEYFTLEINAENLNLSTSDNPNGISDIRLLANLLAAFCSTLDGFKKTYKRSRYIALKILGNGILNMIHSKSMSNLTSSSILVTMPSLVYLRLFELVSTFMSIDKGNSDIDSDAFAEGFVIGSLLAITQPLPEFAPKGYERSIVDFNVKAREAVQKEIAALQQIKELKSMNPSSRIRQDTIPHYILFLSKHYYLLSETDATPYINPELEYGFSIDELKYSNHLRHAYRNVKEGEYSLNLHDKRINSLVGLENLFLKEIYDGTPEPILITSINLSHNRLRSLHIPHLLYGSKVIALDLSNNQLQKIGPMAFKEFSNLEILDLAHNRLEVREGDYLDLKALEGLKRLEVLDLSNNIDIPLYHESLFLPLVSLKRLNVHNSYKIKQGDLWDPKDIKDYMHVIIPTLEIDQPEL